MKKVLIVDDVEGWRKFNAEAVNKILGDEVEIDIADSATSAYSLIIENTKAPYDIIVTDLQMENDYSPKQAGEWLVEQIKSLPSYYKAIIIMISASSYARIVADNNNIFYIPKSSQLNNIAHLEEIIKD